MTNEERVNRIEDEVASGKLPRETADRLIGTLKVLEPGSALDKLKTAASRERVKDAVATVKQHPWEFAATATLAFLLGLWMG